jgi:ABC-2 type transport system permease protein
MKVANFLKKKDTLMIFSGIMGLGLAVVIQIFSSQMVKFEKTPQLMAEMLTGPNSLVSIVGRTYYPSIMATKGILEINSSSGIINAVLFLGISVLLVLLLLYAMSNAYFNSNIGIDEVKKATKKYSESDFKSDLKKKSILSALTLREIKLMNREPIFLLNGPLVIVIMPLIIGLMMFIQKDQMGELFSAISKASGATYYATLAVAGIGMFLGVTGTPSSSAISREGKAFMTIKAMPVRPKEYMNTKLIHSIIIGIIASLMSCLLGYAIVKLPLVNCLIAFVMSNLLMLPIFLAGLFIELKWPKLLWDNPVKAMKQNINVMAVVLGEMFILLPILALLVIFVLKNNSTLSYIVLAAVPGIASVILYKLMIKYAEKRFYEIEI